MGFKEVRASPSAGTFSVGDQTLSKHGAQDSLRLFLSLLPSRLPAELGPEECNVIGQVRVSFDRAVSSGRPHRRTGLKREHSPVSTAADQDCSPTRNGSAAPCQKRENERVPLPHSGLGRTGMTTGLAERSSSLMLRLLSCTSSTNARPSAAPVLHQSLSGSQF